MLLYISKTLRVKWKMQLTVALFLCVTSFVCVRGRQHQDSVLLNFNKDQTTPCGPKMRSIHEMAKNVTCSVPREKLVTLRAQNGNAAIFPLQVYLRRCDCDHKCRNGGQCVSVKREFKKQWISASFGGSTSRKCLEVDLPEDTDCQCRCTKTAVDCNEEMQEFEEKSCSCVCKKAEYYKNECTRKGFGWNNETCMCECPNKMRRCSTGYIWSLDDCTCVKVHLRMSDDGIPQGPMTEDDASSKYKKQS